MQSPNSPKSTQPKRWARVLVSCLLAFHVTAIFVGPWSMRPYDSALSGVFAMVMQPYLRFASLDNGYRFFAPEPGPAHLIRYELTFEDGTSREGVFPDVHQHRPRLYYHRHFMLSEFANTLDSAGMESARARELLNDVVESYAAHLLHEHDARQVELFLRRHNIPWPEDVRQGVSLDDPRWYEEKPLGTFHRDESP